MGGQQKVNSAVYSDLQCRDRTTNQSSCCPYRSQEALDLCHFRLFLRVVPYKGIRKHTTQLTSQQQPQGIEQTFGLRHLILAPNNQPLLNICIDGFLSEASKKQFADWQSGFEQVPALTGGLAGFAWPARNLTTADFSFWYDAVDNAATYIRIMIRYCKSSTAQRNLAKNPLA